MCIYIYIYISTRKELLKEDASITENIRNKYNNIFHDSIIGFQGQCFFFQRLEERGLGRVHASGSRRDEPVDNGSPWRHDM